MFPFAFRCRERLTLFCVKSFVKCFFGPTGESTDEMVGCPKPRVVSHPRLMLVTCSTVSIQGSFQREELSYQQLHSRVARGAAMMLKEGEVIAVSSQV